MFAEYLDAAMSHAVYERIEDGTYFGEIKELPGSWANAPTLEECVQEMRSVAEGWILLAIARHTELPVIDGHTIVVAKVGE
jgi:predicted RNase H-like HicB family nuclease